MIQEDPEQGGKTANSVRSSKKSIIKIGEDGEERSGDKKEEPASEAPQEEKGPEKKKMRQLATDPPPQAETELENLEADNREIREKSDSEFKLQSSDLEKGMCREEEENFH